MRDTAGMRQTGPVSPASAFCGCSEMCFVVLLRVDVVVINALRQPGAPVVEEPDSFLGC